MTQDDAIDGLFLQQATWTAEIGYAINSDDFHALLRQIRQGADAPPVALTAAEIVKLWLSVPAKEPFNMDDKVVKFAHALLQAATNDA